MTLAEINYLEQQLFKVAPLPLNEATHYPYGLDLLIRCHGGNGRGPAQTNWLKITPEQMKKIEEVLLGVV